MKVKCKLSGTNGNVFSIIAKVAGALNKAGLKEEASQFRAQAFDCDSYNEVLQLAMRTVEVS